MPADSGITGCTRMRDDAHHLERHVQHGGHPRSRRRSCAAPTAPARRSTGWSRRAPARSPRAPRCTPARRSRARTGSSSAVGRASIARSSAVNSPGVGHLRRRSSSRPSTANAARGCRTRWPGRRSSGRRSPRGCSCRPGRTETSRSRKKRTCVEAVLLDQLDRVDDVADRLATSSRPCCSRKPWTKTRFGQLDPGRHQERGPVDGVEPGDVLADHVQVGRPVLAERSDSVSGKPTPVR